ncbi:hypothetical protein [Butyrivibrio sp. VCD2006]|uniref:hypothetical protein n=1 Tax=Butyrivibrio sp. VCD2006 TaxID=1280664 RepID=UPI0004256D58|nr:hypothetical protein [Butyrivibrio sp. VCD2006]
MGKLTDFNKNDSKIIDTAYCNGRYTNISTIRSRFLMAGVVLFAAAAFACAQIFLI